MINFDAFDIARKKFPDKKIPFLAELCKITKKKESYKGLKILHNIPLTMEAVLKIEPLLLGGADVTVSCITFLNPHKDALELLRTANVKTQIKHEFVDDYDFCLDCCGELINLVNPRCGAVELTQTGSEIYKHSSQSYPVISVDDSKLKFLETFFGTGDGFLRALLEKTNSEIYNKKFVIFGYGKVGMGIAHALIKFTDDITIVDPSPVAKEAANKRGIKSIDTADLPSIKKNIGSAYCVVTATGVRNLMSDFYMLHKKDFGGAYLANMGGSDEYGKNFLPEDVLFRKKPINFSVSEPTAVKYLDPIFYAHNISIDLILSNKIKAGYNPFPESLATKLLTKWRCFHNETFFDLEDYLK